MSYYEDITSIMGNKSEISYTDKSDKKDLEGGGR